MSSISKVSAQVSTKPTALVGRQSTSALDECKEMGGGVLESSARFSFAHVICDGQQLIVLRRKDERHGQPRKWLIVDEIYLPKLASRVELIPPVFCSIETGQDDAVFAIGKWKRVNDGYVVENMSHAWRFDLQQGKIKSISTLGVKCDSDDPDPPDI